jgi:hypothetical protein
MAWADAVERIAAHVVRVCTPNATGTGFLVSRSRVGGPCGVATAAHVVSDAHEWEHPIRIEHPASGKQLVVKSPDRVILLDSVRDTAAIVFYQADLPLPQATLKIAPENHAVKVGVDVGWVGFPVVSSDNMCFFGGRVSCHLPKQNAYLVDGVAINGVSGGPTFIWAADEVHIVGVVTAYLPNTSDGISMPGLALVADVTQFHEVIKHFDKIDKQRELEFAKSIQMPVAGSLGNAG